VNRWAARHLDNLQIGLESGEEVRAADRVVLTKAKARSALAHADATGFPIPGTIFVLGVSNERLLFWKASKALARPVELVGGLPLGEVAAVRVVTRLWLTRVVVLLEAGPMLIAKPLWGRACRDVASAFDEVRSN
jgi:hypothetical protein